MTIAKAGWQTPKFDEFGDSLQLLCPNCGEGYLHHGTVTVYQRTGEDQGGTRTSCTGISTSVVPVEATAMPGRRDGLEARFGCEHCNLDAVLRIYQHKGTTLLEWC